MPPTVAFGICLKTLVCARRVFLATPMRADTTWVRTNALQSTLENCFSTTAHQRPPVVSTGYSAEPITFFMCSPTRRAQLTRVIFPPPRLAALCHALCLRVDALLLRAIGKHTTQSFVVL